jgi:hypothetical protein
VAREPVEEPYVAPEPVVAEQPLFAEPVVEPAPVAEDDAEAWFVADVQEEPAEQPAPQTDTWSGRPIGS